MKPPINIVGAAVGSYSSIYELSEDMARMKKACKQLQGSNYYITDKSCMVSAANN